MKKNTLPALAIAAIVIWLTAGPAMALVLNDGGIHDDPEHIGFDEILEVYDNIDPPHNYTTVNLSPESLEWDIDAYGSTRLNIACQTYSYNFGHDNSLITLLSGSSIDGLIYALDNTRVFFNAGSEAFLDDTHIRAEDQSSVILTGGVIGSSYFYDDSIFVMTGGIKTGRLQFNGKKAVICGGEIEPDSRVTAGIHTDVVFSGGIMSANISLAGTGKLRIYGGDWRDFSGPYSDKLSFGGVCYIYGSDFNYSYGPFVCSNPDGCKFDPLTGTLADGTPLFISISLSKGGRLILRKSTDLTVVNPTLVSRRRVSRFEYEYTYQAQAANAGHDVTDVKAHVVSVSPHTTVVEGDLWFGDVADGATVPSADTFVVKHDRRQPFDWEALKWDIEYADDAFTNWSKTFGGTDHEIGISVQQTSDGGYILCGYTYTFGADGGDAYLIKTDADGNEMWTKTFGGPGDEIAISVQQTSDGGYILAGDTSSFGAGGGDAYLVKTDENGNELWSRTFGGTKYERASSVRQTSDGGYILAGETSSFGAGGTDGYLIKTDSDGNEVWDRTFGGPDYDYIQSVQQTLDGGYILAGYTWSFGAGRSDAYIIKTDGDGNELWSRIFGGTSYDYINSVQQTTDGGYIFAGYTSSFGAGGDDAYLIKTDGNGNELWSKTFGGTEQELVHFVRQTYDGGYVLAGNTSSFGAGSSDAYLIKTDGNGNELWSKTFGGSSDDFAASIQETSDGVYVLAGATASFGAGSYDVYLIKVSE